MANIKVRIVPNPLYGSEGSQIIHPHMGEVVYRGTLDAVRYSLGGDFFTLEPGVDGSVPTMDAPLSDENERVIRVTNSPKLNARIAAIRPTIVTTTTATCSSARSRP